MKILKSKKFWIIFAVVFGAIALAVCGTACSVNLDYIKFENTTVIYDGTEHELLISGELPEDFTVEYENNKLTNAGTVEATATILNKSGKVKKELKANLTVVPSASVAIPVPESTVFTYTGNEITLEIAQSGLYTVKSGLSATSRGEYSLVLSLTDSHNFRWTDNTSEDKTIDWEILPQKVAVPVLTGEYVYDGLEQTAKIEENELYSISGNKQTNAGAYNAVISLTDKHNYCWSDGTVEDKSIPWVIQKYTYDISQYVEFNDLTTTYNGEEKFITLTGSLPDGVSAYYVGNSGTDAGVYNAYVYFEVAPNYNEIDSMLSAVLTIEKADYDMSGISFDDTEYYFERGKQQSLVIKGTLPQGVTVSYNNNTLTGEQDRTVTQRATAYFSGDTKNYNTIPSMTAEVTVTPLVLNITFETDGGPLVKALNVNRYTLLKDTGLGNLTITRDGYTFIEWTYENGGEIDYSVELLEDVTVFAQWEVESYTLILDTDGGTLNDETESRYYVVYDEQFTLPKPVKENYTFIGYADKQTYTNFIPAEEMNGGIWTYDLSSTESDNELVAVWTYNRPIENGVAVSYADEKVIISINGLGNSGGSFYNIYAVDANSYYYTDSSCGMSEYVDDGTDVVGVYKAGESQRFEFDRKDEAGTDYLFKKYYITNGDKIMKGPVYANDIEAKYTAEDENGYGSWEIKSKKGVLSQIVDTTLDLDCSYTELNFVVTGKIAPNEYVDENGNVTPLDHSGEAGLIPYDFNGTTYYFRGYNFSGYDRDIKRLSDNHIKITLIVYAVYTTDQNQLPYYMTYPSARNYTSSPLTAINTSNPYGAMYWAAFMSFIAERYSSGEYGYVQTFVIGNEVDYPTSWNPVVDYNTERPPSIEAYAEEYYRQMRIADIAVKSADRGNKVLTSFTHYWTSANSSISYGPYYLSEILIKLSREQGNFDWGYAMHPYAPALNAADIFDSGTNSTWWNHSSYLYSNQMTFVNFEQMQQYLEQDYMRYNGQLRSVYITEGGVSSANNSLEEQRQQAAGIAYSYYKMTLLDCVVAFIYYKEYDAPEEGARFGLMTENGEKKESYEMWKNIDKVSPDEYVGYLTSCKYYNPRGGGIRYPFEESDDYLSVLKKMSAACTINFDWDTKWNQIYGTEDN